MTITQAEFKSKWVEALRGGHFMQCQNVLFGSAQYDHTGEALADDYGEFVETRPGHCCLGVALEITGGDISESTDGDEMPTQEWAAKWGITYSDMESLAGLNDGGSSFDFIADVIEFAEFTPYELPEVDTE